MSIGTRLSMRFAIGVVSAVLALLPLAVSAHSEGWVWREGEERELYYDNCVYYTGASDNPNRAWRDAVYSAMDAWTWTPTSIAMWEDSYCSGWTEMINVWNTPLGNPTTLATTTVYHDDDWIWRANILLNADINRVGRYTSFGNLNSAGQISAVLHELGHAIGLAHAGQYAGEPGVAPYSVMDYCCFFQAPTQHDIDDINSYY
jgi:hypothetical protein